MTDLNVPQPSSDLMTPEQVAADYGIPVTTQRVWKVGNRYGWRDLTIKIGASVRYRRAAIELWLVSRTGLAA